MLPINYTLLAQRRRIYVKWLGSMSCLSSASVLRSWSLLRIHWPLPYCMSYVQVSFDRARVNLSYIGRQSSYHQVVTYTHGNTAHQARTINWKRNPNHRTIYRRIWNFSSLDSYHIPNSLIFFLVEQQLHSDLGRFTVEDARTNTISHTHSVGLLWRSDRLFAKVGTYTTHI